MTVHVPDWTPPWPSEGDADLVRITSGAVAGSSPWSCAEQLAKKARPLVWPVRVSRHRVGSPPHDTFPLGLARTALVSILSASGPIDVDTALARAITGSRREAPDETRSAARAAVEGYLGVLDELRSAHEIAADTIVRDILFASDEGSPVEWWAWGILHISRDSKEREFHLLVWSDAGTRERAAASLGVVARVAADAIVASEGARWSERWDPAPAQPREAAEVRIREIGVLDRSSALLHRLTADDARSLFNTTVPAAVDVLAGGTYTPGGHCADCAVRMSCTGVARLPGVLGVVACAPYTRRAAPGDLVAHRRCSWQVWLRRELGMPVRRDAPSHAQERGIAVHAWLEAAHRRGIPCSSADLPDDALGDIATRLGWDELRYRAVRPFLLPHLDDCPVTSDALTVLPEQSLTAWDTDADLVVAMRSDVVVVRPDRVVVRETKTLNPRGFPETEAELLDYVPQVALAICLLADGLDPVTGRVLDSRSAAVVELELLWSDLGQVVRFDVSDPETVHAARVVIADLVDPYLVDDPRPAPGPQCGWCRVSQWCTARSGSVSVDDAPPDDDAPPVHPLDVVLTVELDEDDDIPF